MIDLPKLSQFLLFVVLTGLMFWWNYRLFHSLPLSTARHKVMQIGNVRGWLGSIFLVGYMVIFLLELMQTTDPFWFRLDALLTLAAFVFLFQLKILAPSGLRLPNTRHLTWYSNGKELSIHLSLSKEKDKKCINKNQLSIIKDEIIIPLQQTQLPLLISTPLNVNLLINLFKKDTRFVITEQKPTRLPFLYRCILSIKRSKKSSIPLAAAWKKSKICRSWLITIT